MPNVTSREETMLNLIRKIDPEWQAGRRREIEYQIQNGRVFTADPATRGAYAPDTDKAIAGPDGYGLYTHDGRKLVYG